MQKYCFAYTATHDFKVADEIMADDYTFYMGEHVFNGRERAYKPAAERQFRAYPGLGFIVHDFISNGDRCAMYFSEYGYSAQHGTSTAWHGVSLYRWDHQRLTECRIEQDYYGRRRQLSSKVPDPIDPPAYAPWTGPIDAADAVNERLVAKWLEDGGLLRSRLGSLDDERAAQSLDRVFFDHQRSKVHDILSSGTRVAFHVRIDGIYAGGLSTLKGCEGHDSYLYATGIADVENGEVVKVQAVTDRYTMERRLLAGT
jgi:predicted ester cyclase